MNGAGRYHDFSVGHRVAGHENKCAHLHGHNYRVYFDVVPARATELDSIGRVLDFAGIKLIGDWIERNWDHKFLYWEEDDVMRSFIASLHDLARGVKKESDSDLFAAVTSFVPVPFNPTAECMALHLGRFVVPKIIPPGVRCRRVDVWETRKCWGYWQENTL